jgi:hypothetical protein
VSWCFRTRLSGIGIHISLCREIVGLGRILMRPSVRLNDSAIFLCIAVNVHIARTLRAAGSPRVAAVGVAIIGMTSTAVAASERWQCR